MFVLTNPLLSVDSPCLGLYVGTTRVIHETAHVPCLLCIDVGVPFELHDIVVNFTLLCILFHPLLVLLLRDHFPHILHEELAILNIG